MSRVGKKPILMPEGVEVKIDDGRVVVKGPKGELSKEIRPEIRIESKDEKIFVTSITSETTKESKAIWGSTRAILANMIRGVKDGYAKKLELEGVGYRANVEPGAPDQLVLSVGFSHQVKIKAPDGIKFSVEKNIITISGIDKELVGQTAAKIRAVKPPEPYKGKGIRYQGEQIRRKLGKKAVATPK